MATLNLCSGCNKNFASPSAHHIHRTGSFQEKTRRCLTSEELLAKGWTREVEPVKSRLENKPIVTDMETWHTPMTEDAKAYFAALNARNAGAEEEEDEPEED